jgi:CRP-like cAMP-binding protein
MSDRRLSLSVVPEAAPPVGGRRKHSLASAAMVAAIAVGSSGADPKPSSHSPSAATRKSVAGSDRRPTLTSVAIATIAVGSPSLVPSSRLVAAATSSSSRKKQQQLVMMRATRRSFSSSGTFDAQRIELCFHVPSHADLQRLRVPSSLTLIGLHALVQREFAIPFEDQRIYWHGDLLEGNEDLAFYGLHDQSVLNLRVHKRYRSLGAVFTKIKTVVSSPSHSVARPSDYEIIEVVAPLPPTHVVFKRLVTIITYLQRLDLLQAQRTQRRVWKDKVAFWEDPVAASASRTNTSLVKTARAGSNNTSGVETETPLPPAFVKLHSGPERVSYVVSLAHTHLISQRLQLAPDQRTPSDLRHIKKWLASLKFFAGAALPDAALHDIARACAFVRFRAGDFIFRQGDVGDHFYIVVSGCVSLAAVGNGLFATMTPGQCFGEISLSGGSSGLRTASATVNFAAPVAELALLSGEIYRRVINPFKKAVLQTTEKAIYSVPQLRALPDHIITHVAYASKKLEAKQGRLLVRRGEDVNVLVVLIKGEVKVSATAKSSQRACAFVRV